MFNRTIPLRSVDVIGAVAAAGVNQFNNANSVGQFQKIAPLIDLSALQKIRESFFARSENQETAKPNLEVFFTQDPSLLKQYYDLRQRAYREDNGWGDYDGSENIYDRSGKIVVVTDNGKVVGGMRFLVSNWIDHFPNEEPSADFTYRSFLKKVGLNPDLLYSEISGIAVSPGYRDRTATKKMFSLLINESIKNNCSYMVGVGVSVACRDYKLIFKSLGRDVKIVLDFPWIPQKNYGYVKRFPMFCLL